MSPNRIRILTAGCTLALAALSGGPAAAQETPDEIFNLLRQDLLAEKADIVGQVLDLTDADADVFWPIYREYEKELTALGDRRIAVIERFLDAEGVVVDDDEAAGFAKDYFDLQTDRIKLWKKYNKKIAKAISPLVAARFIQTENLIGKMIDLQIATELPLIR